MCVHLCIGLFDTLQHCYVLVCNYIVDELLMKLARSQELMEKINAAIAPQMPEVRCCFN